MIPKGVVQTYNSLDYDGNRTYGGYSQKIVVKEGFVVRIPDNLSMDAQQVRFYVQGLQHFLR